MIILKNETTEFVKECYDENEYAVSDVVNISRGQLNKMNYLSM